MDHNFQVGDIVVCDTDNKDNIGIAFRMYPDVQFEVADIGEFRADGRIHLKHPELEFRWWNQGWISPHRVRLFEELEFKAGAKVVILEPNPDGNNDLFWSEEMHQMVGEEGIIVHSADCVRKRDWWSVRVGGYQDRLFHESELQLVGAEKRLEKKPAVVHEINQAEVNKFIDKFRAECKEVFAYEEEPEGVADFTVVGFNKKTGEYLNKCGIGEACHYDLKIYGYTHWEKRIVEIVAVNTSIGRYKYLDGLKQAHRRFVKWMLKESPWKSAFQFKSIKDAYENGIMLNLNATGNQLASACIALRQATEYPDTCDTFKFAIDKGFDPAVGFILSNFFYRNEEKKWERADITSSHTALSTGMLFKEVIDFFVNGFKQQGDKPYKESPDYNDAYGAIAHSSYWRKGIDKDQTLDKVIQNQTKLELVGNGFQRAEVLTEQSVLDVCTFIQKEIEGAKA